MQIDGVLFVRLCKNDGVLFVRGTICPEPVFSITLHQLPFSPGASIKNVPVTLFRHPLQRVLEHTITPHAFPHCFRPVRTEADDGEAGSGEDAPGDEEDDPRDRLHQQTSIAQQNCH